MIWLQGDISTNRALLNVSFIHFAIAKYNFSLIANNYLFSFKFLITIQ